MSFEEKKMIECSDCNDLRMPVVEDMSAGEKVDV